MDTNVEVKWTEMKIYEDLLNFVETGEISVPAEEMTAFCKRKIAVLNNKKVKAKERAEKTKAVYFMPHIVSRAVAIPLDKFIVTNINVS